MCHQPHLFQHLSRKYFISYPLLPVSCIRNIDPEFGTVVAVPAVKLKRSVADTTSISVIHGPPNANETIVGSQTRIFSMILAVLSKLN